MQKNAQKNFEAILQNLAMILDWQFFENDEIRFDIWDEINRKVYPRTDAISREVKFTPRPEKMHFKLHYKNGKLEMRRNHKS